MLDTKKLLRRKYKEHSDEIHDLFKVELMLQEILPTEQRVQ